jgi:nitrate/TMAO reductase-like tetraheme cytochrome c subunit
VRPGVNVVPIPVRWFLALLVTSAWLVPLAADTPKPPANDDCLVCHGEPSTIRADGRPVVVAPAAFNASVHGTLGMTCVDCHADLAHTTDFPHAERLARVNCATCHDKPVAEHSATVHGHASTAGAPAASCVDCHGMHDILPASDPASRTYALNIPATCGRCHGRSGPPAAPKVADEYRDSIHARALLAKGLVVAPTCVSCHGAHDVRRHADEHSKVARAQVVATCTTCHQGIGPAYEASVHAQAVKAGNALAPVCSDCHSAHHIAETSTDAWKLAIVRECGTCHESRLRTYRDTFHGKVTDLGYTRAARCADCHGAHEILPASNPASTVAPGNRVKTCRTCHPNASENFAQYDPHADPGDRARNPGFYYAAKFMRALLGGVFLFFGIHSLLWLPRSWQRRRQRRAAHSASDPGGTA